MLVGFPSGPKATIPNRSGSLTAQPKAMRPRVLRGFLAELALQPAAVEDVVAERTKRATVSCDEIASDQECLGNSFWFWLDR